MDYKALLHKFVNAQTPTLQNHQNPINRGSVGSVGTPLEPFQKNISIRRLALFRYRGIPDDEAQALTDRLIRRDEQHDDRRSCAECLSFYAGNCRQRLTPIGETTIYTLHRCKGFKHTEMASNSKWPETH